jgi:hypothetical protein
VIARWKGIVEEIHFGGSIMPSNIIENLDLEKLSFGPSKWPQKLKPAKNSKLPKWPENCFEPFGNGGWPSISTWIKYFNVILLWNTFCFSSWSYYLNYSFPEHAQAPNLSTHEVLGAYPPSLRPLQSP